MTKFSDQQFSTFFQLFMNFVQNFISSHLTILNITSDKKIFINSISEIPTITNDKILILRIFDFRGITITWCSCPYFYRSVHFSFHQDNAILLNTKCFSFGLELKNTSRALSDFHHQLYRNSERISWKLVLKFSYISIFL